MSQLCHSCGIWWANSTSLSAVPAYASASTKADRGEVSLPLRCSLLHMLTSDIVPRKLEIQPLIYFTPQCFLCASDGPNTFATFSFTALQPCCYLRMLVARCQGQSNQSSHQRALNTFRSTEYEYCIMWLAEQFGSASWTLSPPYKHLH